MINHQQLHQNDSNFLFKCPLCTNSIEVFKTLKKLLVHFHSAHKPGKNCSIPDGRFPCTVAVCSFSSDTIKNLSLHQINVHLSDDSPSPVMCAYGGCSHAETPFSKKKVYRTHLSQYHSSCKTTIQDKTQPGEEAQSSNSNRQDTSDFSNDVFFPFDDQETCHNHPDQSPSFFVMDDDIVVKAIAKFYLMLEADKLVPTSTVQNILESMVFISELTQARLKIKLTEKLKELNIETSIINSIVYDLQITDPLYATHHVNCPGPSLTSDYFRSKFYTKYFGYKDPVQINLSLDPSSKNKIQYVPLRETLNELLADPCVKDQVIKSFNRKPSPPGKLNDYYDGEAYKKREKSEEPTLDIFFIPGWLWLTH